MALVLALISSSIFGIWAFIALLCCGSANIRWIFKSACRAIALTLAGILATYFVVQSGAWFFKYTK